MNYQENIRSKSIALQILNDRAGIRKVQLENLEKQIKHNSKGENFKRLANIRVNHAIKSLRTIKGLSNTSRYFYNDYQVQEIMSKLKENIKILSNKFNNKSIRKI